MTLLDALEMTRQAELPSYTDWYKQHLPQNYTFPAHIEYLCGIAEKVLSGEIKRLILTMPPQHAKSDTFTRRLPVYWGAKNPGDNILLTGYSQEFAENYLSHDARNLAVELGLAAEGQSLKRWKFKTGGTVTTRGVGNPPTGVPRLKLIIIDDPLSSREDANSETIRNKNWEWLQGSIFQRAWPDTVIILILTRWHEDDIAGRLIAEGTGWTVINLPAIAEENDLIGRELGEPLWPDAKPLSFLEDQRRDMGEYEFEALFQGNPTPKEGALFKVSQFKEADSAPDVSNVLEYDFGSTTGGDWTAAGQVWRDPVSGQFYVDVARVQYEPYMRDSWIATQADAREPQKISIPQDPGAAGKAQSDSMVKLLAGHNVEVTKISGDKETRAMPFAAQVNAGKVTVLNSPWREDFIEECRQFPNGKHDDMVDAVAGAFNQLMKKRERGRSLSRRGSGYV